LPARADHILGQLARDLARFECRRERLGRGRHARRVAAEDQRAERQVIDPSRRAAADSDERQAAEQLVVWERCGDRRLDVDAVLDQHDDGARSDRLPDQRGAVHTFEHLGGQQQVVGRLAALGDFAIDTVRPEAMVAEHRAVDVIAVAADSVVVGATDHGHSCALACERRSEQSADCAGADDEDVHCTSVVVTSGVVTACSRYSAGSSRWKARTLGWSLNTMYGSVGCFCRKSW
jgi:hypothetical protein